MKTVSYIACAAAFIFASASCDKHSWKETQVLHEGMHKDHGKEHKDSHAKPADHAGEKKDH
ncbi:MAG: hypothetical protein JNG86_15905 [Verrucomicrobiaceae bacterium]|jgi:hypothetical protein|nr:hypothetical protein [Verrucomicrobiaceae bacterium]